MHTRVFVTGVGIISAIGNGTEETHSSLNGLRSGIGPLSLFESVHYNIPVAEVKYSNSQLSDIAGVDPALETYTRNTLLALIAARQAISSSGWHNSASRRNGCIMATTVGGMDYNERYYKSLLEGKYRDHLSVLDSADSTEKVAAQFGIRHHVTTISTACSSSANAIMLGARLIRNKRVSRVLVGGTDSLTKFTLNGFFALEILSPTGCRPFDSNRNGLTIGEGAAMLVLESEETADPRSILCEIAGFANVNEAYHQTASSSDGSGALLAMTKALESASLTPGDIGYINAHGTGTEINDLSEGRAIDSLFRSRVPPMSSTKGFTGHTLGAAGAVEAVISVLALKNQVAWPGLNLTQSMPELNFTPLSVVTPRPIRHVLSNSFGFGGNNTSLIFSNL
jgi:3-oxoacyl-(acyl-carrier-protein) synthase